MINSDLLCRGVATEKFSGGHLKIGGAQRGYFRNFGRFYGFFIAISEIIGGARARIDFISSYFKF